MGFEKFDSGMPMDDNKEIKPIDLPEEERNKISKERHNQEEESFRTLEQKALTSMAGGTRLTFREKQEVISGWNSRLSSNESRELIDRLNDVK